MMKRKIVLSAVAMLTLLSPLPALADYCKYSTRGPVIATIPLVTANISVGADVAVNTVIHRQYIGGADNYAPFMDCNVEAPSNDFTVNEYLTLQNVPQLVPNWTGQYAGYLYQTSLPGVGVAFINKDGEGVDQPFGQSQFRKWTFQAGRYNTIPLRNKFTLVFIKTGTVTGGVINGASLPTVVMNTTSPTPVTGLPSESYRQNFSGLINVVVNSCQTPDVSVQMGSYGLGSYFNGKTTSTPWVPFSVNLLNCPAFYGTYTSDTSSPSWFYGGGTLPGALTASSLQMKLTPIFGAVDSGQGIIKLDGSAGSAQGVGIQLASGAAGNPNPTLQNLALPIVQYPSSTGITNQAFPLQARYVATGGTVTPGPANSKVTFTINYY